MAKSAALTLDAAARLMGTTRARASARLAALGHTETCSRCGGGGRYSFNQVDGDRCFKCGGAGKTLVRVTLAIVSQAIARIAAGELDEYLARARARGQVKTIDYDLAIAEDDAGIAWAQRSIERGWYRRQLPFLDGSGVLDVDDLLYLVVYFRDVATAIGYSAQDVADLANFAEIDVWRRHADLPDGRPGRDGYRRGKEIVDEIHVSCERGRLLYRDEVTARVALRKAKASRARHVRNREKYGKDEIRRSS